jgi:hypothetical protein
MQYYQEIRAFYAGLPTDLYPTLTRLTPHMVDPNVDRFAFGLTVMLAGLEAVSNADFA